MKIIKMMTIAKPIAKKAYRLLGFKVSVYEDRFTLTLVTNNDVCVT